MEYHKISSLQNRLTSDVIFGPWILLLFSFQSWVALPFWDGTAGGWRTNLAQRLILYVSFCKHLFHPYVLAGSCDNRMGIRTPAHCVSQAGWKALGTLKTQREALNLWWIGISSIQRFNYLLLPSILPGKSIVQNRRERFIVLSSSLLLKKKFISNYLSKANLCFGHLINRNGGHQLLNQSAIE